MATIVNRTNTRHANIAKAANQAAEAALCHYAHLNGVTFTDAEFDAAKYATANGILEQLHRVEHAKARDELAVALHREPRTIPAVVTKW